MKNLLTCTSAPQKYIEENSYCYMFVEQSGLYKSVACDEKFITPPTCELPPPYIDITEFSICYINDTMLEAQTLSPTYFHEYPMNPTHTCHGLIDRELTPIELDAKCRSMTGTPPTVFTPLDDIGLKKIRSRKDRGMNDDTHDLYDQSLYDAVSKIIERIARKIDDAFREKTYSPPPYDPIASIRALKIPQEDLELAKEIIEEVSGETETFKQETI